MKKTQGIQVISRAIKILRLLSERGTSLGELARMTDLPRSTVQRIVDTLAAENLVETGGCGVRLGWGLNELAKNAYSDVVAQLRHPLEILFEKTRETVDISTYHGREVIFLDRIVSDQAVRVVPIYDRPKPIYAMANGKAMLSLLTDEQIVSILNGQMPALTRNTVTDIPTLLKQIAEVRATGLSLDIEEHEEGICAVGIPLVIPGQSAHAISVVLPSYRFNDRLPEIKNALLMMQKACTTILQPKTVLGRDVGIRNE
ncbi:transcriptional regulator [Pectobacterium araliae]|uniref:IclR family transcriptional regulator n=1 Tax=Pectobacterium araliae TaxID=3073862 RepID=A0AAN0KIC1_9GAMM|nr:IclR family transcriptional regulator [Pectobacterium sp. MAFF 302110]GKW20916.1 transcriptional regulator [Pectobacterium carotovorum subsp. carotovorum]